MMMVSGCLTEKIDETIDDLVTDDYQFVDDGQLIIVTYDVSGLTDTMISTFENETGLQFSSARAAELSCASRKRLFQSTP